MKEQKDGTKIYSPHRGAPKRPPTRENVQRREPTGDRVSSGRAPTGGRTVEGQRRRPKPPLDPRKGRGATRKGDSQGIGGFVKAIKEKMTPKLTVIAIVGTVALVFAICMLVNIIIGVRSIEVEGNYLASAEEIAAVAGVETGSGYFSYNTSKSEKRVLENIHCISEINISRSVFGKVRITVTETRAVWYIGVYGEYYALSEELLVIRQSDLRDEFIAKGLVRLDLPEIKRAVLGMSLEYADEDRDCRYVPEFLAEVTESELYKNGRINEVDIETKFSILVVCDLKYRIQLGKHR